MKRTAFLILFCAIAFLAPAAEMKEIAAIREYYAETLKKIKNESIYHRELFFSYPVIPGVGPTSSRVMIYYDMSAGRDGQYEYQIIRVENYYQHTVRVFYEEYLYNSKGDPVFYYGRTGTGDIGRPDAIEWGRDERYYFWGGRLIRVMHGEETTDRPSAAEAKKGAELLLHAKELRTKSCLVYVPAPVMFRNDGGEQ
jgi:hypothetical protein